MCYEKTSNLGTVIHPPSLYIYYYTLLYIYIYQFRIFWTDPDPVLEKKTLMIFFLRRFFNNIQPQISLSPKVWTQDVDLVFEIFWIRICFEGFINEPHPSHQIWVQMYKSFFFNKYKDFF